MPSKIIDYSNTVIYKIVCNDLNITDLYIGNTTNFTKRKTSHKNGCVNEKNKAFNYKIYKIIRENGGWDNWSMIEIEKYPCNDGNEARARERYYYEFLNASLNTFNPITNLQETKIKQKQYRIDNKQDLRDKRIIYRKTIKDKIKIENKKYREIRKEKNIVLQNKIV